MKVVSESSDAEIDSNDETDNKLEAIEQSLKAPFSEVIKTIFLEMHDLLRTKE